MVANDFFPSMREQVSFGSAESDRRHRPLRYSLSFFYKICFEIAQRLLQASRFVSRQIVCIRVLDANFLRATFSAPVRSSNVSTPSFVFLRALSICVLTLFSHFAKGTFFSR